MRYETNVLIFINVITHEFKPKSKHLITCLLGTVSYLSYSYSWHQEEANVSAN